MKCGNNSEVRHMSAAMTTTVLAAHCHESTSRTTLSNSCMGHSRTCDILSLGL